MASKQSANDGNLLTSTALRLMEYLRQNSSLQIALYLYQLFKEQILHASPDNWQNTEAEEFDTQTHWELLEACVQKVHEIGLFSINAQVLTSLSLKVLTSRCIDHWLGLGYMISLPMDKAYNTFRVSRIFVILSCKKIINILMYRTVWRQ